MRPTESDVEAALAFIEEAETQLANAKRRLLAEPESRVSN